MNTFNLPELISSIYEKCDTFIVIGAFDGESHDDFFIRIKEKNNKNNNKIIFVEPVQKYYNNLLEKVKSLTEFDVICENVAISNKQEIVNMVSVKPNLLDKYGWYIEGCSCVVEEGTPLNIYMKEVNDEDIDTETSNAITLQELLNNHGLTNVDFLQIDTEGYDERIVDSINFDETNILFLKFEKHYLSDGFIDKLINKLEILDYSYYWDNDNYYFVKNEIING